MRGLEADMNGAEAHLHACCGHIRAIAPPYCQTQRSPVTMMPDSPLKAPSREACISTPSALTQWSFFDTASKIDVTGGEASMIPTNWPAPVTFPRCAQIADQRSGRWHTTDGARGKAAMAFFSENLHGHPQSEGCDTLCYSVTQSVATSGRIILIN